MVCLTVPCPQDLWLGPVWGHIPSCQGHRVLPCGSVMVAVWPQELWPVTLWELGAHPPPNSPSPTTPTRYRE